MRSYKLHVAIVTIACIALQEVKCIMDEDVYIGSAEEDDAADTAANAAAPAAAPAAPVVYPEQDCGEYKSEIWDDAFSNPKTMQLAYEYLKTAEDMVADPVCSDTTRAVINYLYTKTTNENAHFVEVNMYKLLKTITKQAIFTDADHVGETRMLMRRMVESPDTRDLVVKTFSRSADLLRDPKNRVRMMKMVLSILQFFKQSKEEMMVKQTVKNVKKVIASPFKASKGAIKKLIG